VYSNDIAPQSSVHYQYDALSRINWECMGDFDYVVTSPPFEVLDLAIPLLLEHTRFAAFVHVPGDYPANSRYRTQVLTALSYSLRVVYGLPMVPGRPIRPCIWLCIFKTRTAERALWLDSDGFRPPPSPSCD